MLEARILLGVALPKNRWQPDAKHGGHVVTPDTDPTHPGVLRHQNPAFSNNNSPDRPITYLPHGVAPRRQCTSSCVSHFVSFLTKFLPKIWLQHLLLRAVCGWFFESHHLLVPPQTPAGTPLWACLSVFGGTWACVGFPFSVLSPSDPQRLLFLLFYNFFFLTWLLPHPLTPVLMLPQPPSCFIRQQSSACMWASATQECVGIA